MGSLEANPICSIKLGVKEYFKTIKNGNSTRVYKIGTYANWTPKIIDIYISGTSSTIIEQFIVYIMNDANLSNSRLFYKTIYGADYHQEIDIYCMDGVVYLKVGSDITINFRDNVEEVTGVDLTSAYEVTKQQLT